MPSCRRRYCRSLQASGAAACWAAPGALERAWGVAVTQWGRTRSSWSATCRESECPEGWECWGVTVPALPVPGGPQAAAEAGGSGLE